MKYGIIVKIKSLVIVQIVTLLPLKNFYTMRLNESYSKVRVGKHFSDMFPVKNGLKQRDA